MELYEGRKGYKLFGRFVSVVNIFLQIYVLSLALELSIGFWLQLAAIVAAYLLTDFINGMVHLYMDDNDNYESLAGTTMSHWQGH